MKIIKYKIESVDHKVFIEKNPLERIVNDLTTLQTDKKILFVYDVKINKEIINNYISSLKVSGCKVFAQPVLGGKENKNVKFLLKIIDILSDLKFTRRSVIISCGGGVVGDVSGLAGCLYMRGMIYFHVPTTMMAILDSCIGGKTAINYNHRINLIGTYYHPLRVYISLDIIKESPNKEYFSGMAEAIKCGIIDNKKILNILEKDQKKIIIRDYLILEELCHLVLKTKIKFFLKDIKENNLRLILNFGHTFAHAIEMSLEKNFKSITLSHGEAVSIGLLCEMYYAGVKKKFTLYIEKLLEQFNLPTKLILKTGKNLNFLQKDIFKNIFLDKKKISKFPKYIFISKQGKPIIKYLDNLDRIDETILKFIK
jgi:3-dehydroquinate synthase